MEGATVEEEEEAVWLSVRVYVYILALSSL